MQIVTIAIQKYNVSILIRWDKKLSTFVMLCRYIKFLAVVSSLFIACNSWGVWKGQSLHTVRHEIGFDSFVSEILNSKEKDTVVKQKYYSHRKGGSIYYNYRISPHFIVGAYFLNLQAELNSDDTAVILNTHSLSNSWNIFGPSIGLTSRYLAINAGYGVGTIKTGCNKEASSAQEKACSDKFLSNSMQQSQASEVWVKLKLRVTKSFGLNFGYRIIKSGGIVLKYNTSDSLDTPQNITITTAGIGYYF